MSLKTTLEDGSGQGYRASVVKPSEHESAGLFVFTDDYIKHFSNFRTVPLTNSVYGADMAINASVGGTPVGVYNGGDSVLWTASALSGTWDFVSTTQAHTGTASVDATATVDSDTALFQGGATVNMANYTALSGWIFLTTWPSGGTKNVNFRFRIGGVDVGVAVGVGSYVDVTQLNTWQKFVIPKSAFGFDALLIDEVTVTTVDIGANPPPSYFLDDLQIEETGGAVIYQAAPRSGFEYFVTHLGVTLADGLTGTYPNNLSYDKLLNVATLSTGFTFSVRQRGKIIFSSSFRRLFDIIRLPVASQMYGGSDGTNTWIKINFDLTDANIRLDADYEDNISVSINDDMSGLLEFNVFARGVEISRH